MKKLNFDEMQKVTAGGCGWLRRASRRAYRQCRDEAAVGYASAWVECKRQ